MINQEWPQQVLDKTREKQRKTTWYGTI